MLTSRWEGIPENDRRELIQTIARQARNLEHLVERLIVAAQLEAGMVPSAAMRSVDAGAAIEQAAEQFRAMSKIHSIEVDVEEPLMAEADSKMLQEVLGHLLENAIKYSPAGGPIRVKGRRDGGRVVVSVEDEGVGLPSDASGIFEKFVQGEAVDTRTHDEGGVGVGLFIVRTYMDRMRGSVRAERLRPTGARFEITLKAARN
jgi:signal transduction histidine kinase